MVKKYKAIFGGQDGVTLRDKGLSFFEIGIYHFLCSAARSLTPDEIYNSGEDDQFLETVEDGLEVLLEEGLVEEI